MWWRSRRLQGLQEAAAACGLQDVKISRWRSGITARAGPVAVQIKPGGTKGRSTRIVVWNPGPSDFYWVGIHRPSRLRKGQEIELGDFSFDSTFFLEGPVRLVLALLNAETRQLLVRMNTGSRLEISFGTVRADHLSDEEVPNVLPLLLDLARRLSSAADVPRRLAANANRDPNSRVRLRNLLVLIRELPEAPETLEALRAARSDQSLEIRLRAAQALGAEGRDALLDLAEGLVDDAVSAEALSALLRELPFDRLRVILADALPRRRFRTVRVCLEALGQSRHPAAVDVLARVLAFEEAEPAIVAAWALGATGSPAAEAALLEALRREEAGLRVTAAAALGRVGSAAAVLPLQEAEESSRDQTLRSAARQAVAEIQSRLQGASPGQLSLDGTEAGQLSLTQDDVGRLSLTPGETGRLSLAADPVPPQQPAREAADGRS